MSRPKFDEYIGGGYWLLRDGIYIGAIRTSRVGWYGASWKVGDSASFHGPYLFKRTAKKKALAQLALIRSTDEQEGITWAAEPDTALPTEKIVGDEKHDLLRVLDVLLSVLNGEVYPINDITRPHIESIIEAIESILDTGWTGEGYTVWMDGTGP